MSQLTLISMTLIFSLAGGILGGLLKNKVRFIPSVFTGLSFTSSLILLFRYENPVMLRWEWLNNFELGILLDKPALILLSLVCLISLLVHIFSTKYMEKEIGVKRYFAKLGFFTFSMLGLILSDNLILFFIFWELVGLASYLLIGFWYRKEGVPASAKTAFMVNRIADVALFAGILIVNAETESLFISELSGKWLLIPSILITIGAFGKSAQLPFSGWLTKAMVGPTPVSALIHAATMVAAGVYLLFRVSPFLNEQVMTFIAITGAATAFYGGVSALNQFDIKKVLAYSTISQLGYMVIGIGVGSGEASMFHLWTHAFFKAGLFLGAGSIIHYLHEFSKMEKIEFDAQDMRIMGGLKERLPWTFWSFLACGLSLAGIPFFSGFMSKEGIIISAWSWAAQKGTIAYLVPDLALVTVLLTSLYVGRTLILVFFGKNRLDRTSEIGTSNESGSFRIPLVILAAASLWFFYRWNPFAHNSWLSDFFGTGSVIGDGHVSFFATAISVTLSLGGLVLTYFLFRSGGKGFGNLVNAMPPVSLSGKMIFNGFYLIHLYKVIGTATYSVSKMLAWIDRRVIDGFVHFIGVGSVVFAKVTDLVDKLIIDGLVNLTSGVASGLGRKFSGMHARDVQSQLIWLVIALVLILSWILLF